MKLNGPTFLSKFFLILFFHYNIRGSNSLIKSLSLLLNCPIHTRSPSCLCFNTSTNEIIIHNAVQTQSVLLKVLIFTICD